MCKLMLFHYFHMIKKYLLKSHGWEKQSKWVIYFLNSVFKTVTLHLKSPRPTVYNGWTFDLHVKRLGDYSLTYLVFPVLYPI